MRVARRLIPLLAGLALVVPAGASGAVVDQVFSDYQSHGQVSPCRFSSVQLEAALKGVTPDLTQYAPDFPAAIQAAISARAAGACDEATGQTTTTAAAAPAGSGTAGAGSSGAGASAAAGAAVPASGARSSVAGAGGAGSGGAGAVPPGQSTSTPQPAASPQPAPGTADDAIAAAAADRASQDSGSGAPAPLVGLAALLAVLALVGLVVAAVRLAGVEPAWAVRLRHAAAEAGWRTSAAWSEFTDWVRLGR